MSNYPSQTTDFRVRHLFIKIPQTNVVYDLSNIFQELNLYDGLFVPCMSGNILIVDSLDLRSSLSIDGDEEISIFLDKQDVSSGGTALEYRKRFVIYKISNVERINMTTKTYILHFVNADYWKSERKKVNQYYEGLHSETVKNILTQKLNVTDGTPNDGNSGIASIFPSIGQKKVIIPNLTPFETIEWITQRAIPNNEHKKYPEYVFYEAPRIGYNFMPLGELLSFDARFDINFSPKNMSEGNDDVEFLGVRDFKMKSTFNGIQDTITGVYGGRFIGFDPITRKKTSDANPNVIRFMDVFNSLKHANQYPILPLDQQKQQILTSPDSRIVTHAFMRTPRLNSAYINEKDQQSINTLEIYEDIIFQRKMILYNLMQRRMEVTLPGNFGLASGVMVKMNVPKQKFVKDNESNLDQDLTGKYIIIGTRHVIRPTLHETIIEIATDSTNKNSAPPIDYNNPN